MNRHRVFIAINLPEGVKRRLSAVRDEFPALPCRWTKKENLHLTLLFLGYLNDEQMLEICASTREVAQKHPPFSLEFQRIVYGPPSPRRSHGEGGRKPPRLVWAEGRPSAELEELQTDLEKALYEKIEGQEEARGFAPHITLGRIKTWEARRLEAEEMPQINREISLSFPVDSIEVMESELKREGPEYTILESVPLSN